MTTLAPALSAASIAQQHNGCVRSDYAPACRTHASDWPCWQSTDLAEQIEAYAATVAAAARADECLALAAEFDIQANGRPTLTGIDVSDIRRTLRDRGKTMADLFEHVLRAVQPDQAAALRARAQQRLQGGIGG